MSVRAEDDTVVATSRTAGTAEMLQIRSAAVTEVDSSNDIPDEEKGSVNEIEINYV